MRLPPVLRTLPPRAMGPGEIARAALIVLGITALAVLAWQLTDVLALTFAAVLVALLVRSISDTVARWIPVHTTWLVIATSILLAVAFGAFVYFLGAQFSDQLQSLSERLPPMLDRLGAMLGTPDLGDQITARLREIITKPGIVEELLGVTAGLIGIAVNVLLVVFAGFYMALKPDLYAGGLLLLFPAKLRARLARAVDESGRALRLWLVGQLISMLLVGSLTGVGLFLLGVPSAMALSIIAGILEFIPYVGPWLSAVPALLAAATLPGAEVYWVAGLYLLVQQFEGNIITPLVQKRAVDLPPAITIMSLAAMGVVFGPIGLLIATPLAVVLMVLVTQLYVRDTLHEAASLPGEHGGRTAGTVADSLHSDRVGQRR